MTDYTDLKARLRARAGKWVEERFGGIVWVLDDPDLPAEALVAIEELEQRVAAQSMGNPAGQLLAEAPASQAVGASGPVGLPARYVSIPSGEPPAQSSDIKSALGELQVTLHNAVQRIEHVGDYNATKDGAFYNEAKRALALIRAALASSAAPAPEPGPHGPVSERFMRHHYGPSGYVKNEEGPEELGPQPAPGFHFDDRGVLVPDAAPQPATEPVATRLKAFIREVRPGQCKMLSLGDGCECPLCDVDRLLAAPQPAQADEARELLHEAEQYAPHTKHAERIRSYLARTGGEEET